MRLWGHAWTLARWSFALRPFILIYFESVGAPPCPPVPCSVIHLWRPLASYSLALSILSLKILVLLYFALSSIFETPGLLILFLKIYVLVYLTLSSTFVTPGLLILFLKIYVLVYLALSYILETPGLLFLSFKDPCPPVNMFSQSFVEDPCVNCPACLQLNPFIFPFYVLTVCNSLPSPLTVSYFTVHLVLVNVLLSLHYPPSHCFILYSTSSTGKCPSVLALSPLSLFHTLQYIQYW